MQHCKHCEIEICFKILSKLVRPAPRLTREAANEQSRFVGIKLYHCVEFWAVWVIILKIFHSFLNLCNTSQILVQSAGRPKKKKKKQQESHFPQHKRQLC